MTRCADVKQWGKRHVSVISTVLAAVAVMVNISFESEAATDPQLHYLPENHRYWEWKGLPLYSIMNDNHIAECDWIPVGEIPDKAEWGSIAIIKPFGRVFDRYRSCDEIFQRGTDPWLWQEVRRLAKIAEKHDILVMTMWHDGHYNCEAKQYHSAFVIGTRVYKERESEYLKILELAGEYTGDLTNIIHVPIFENQGANQSSQFPVWWLENFRKYVKQYHPDKSGPMFSLMSHTTTRGYNSLIGEFNGAGVFADPDRNPPSVWEANVPLLRFTSSAYGASNKAGRCPWKVYGYNEGENRLQQKQILSGYHTAESYGGTTGMDVRHWFQQVTYYIENIKTWENEPQKFGGDEITQAKLPKYAKSERPSLSNPSGYVNGVKVKDGTLSFGCIYEDSDNDAPAQAEVWVDRNGDGRYNPNPDAGERVGMTGQGTSYSSGVTYTADNVSVSGTIDNKVMYIFRFADKNWYPPVTGGVVDGVTKGVPRTSWTVDISGETVHVSRNAARSDVVVHSRAARAKYVAGIDRNIALPARATAHDILGRRIGSAGSGRMQMHGVIVVK